MIISKLLCYIDKIIHSNYYGLALACFALFCYYLSLDIVLIWLISLNITFVYGYSKNLSPFLIQMLFMHTMISIKNSPSNAISVSNYYFEPIIYIQCIIAIAIPAIFIIKRLAYNFIKRRNPINGYFYGLIVFCISLMMNGIFSEYYVFDDFLFSLIYVFFFFIIFYALTPDVMVDKQTMLYLSKNICYFTMLLLIELITSYIFHNPFVDGVILKSGDHLFFGWGIWNTMGMLLVVSLPFVVYLIIIEKKNWKFIYIVLALLILVAIGFTASKQSYIAIMMMIIILVIYFFIKGNSKIRIFIFSLLIICIPLIIVILHNYGMKLLELIDGTRVGTPRLDIYKDAISVYLKYPIFGGGFYGHLSDGGYGLVGLTNIVPPMFHNTVLQLLATGGTWCLISYLYLRYKSIVFYFRNISLERTIIAFSLIGFLTMSLLDIHLFNILGTAIYGALIAFFMKEKNV